MILCTLVRVSASDSQMCSQHQKSINMLDNAQENASTVNNYNVVRCSSASSGGVKPAAGLHATSDFSCNLIDKRSEGPLEMRVDC